MSRAISIFLSLLGLSLFAQEAFVSSHVCSKCHPLIYQEYMGSMHRNASVANDPVHAAVWKKHPLNAKKEYKCAACHSPSDTELMKALKEGEPAMPAQSGIQKNEPIGCAYCHRIQAIQPHADRNINIIDPKKRRYYSAKEGKTADEKVRFHSISSFFGLSRKTEGSPFHTIDYTNPIYTDGKVCMGCHSHKRNGKGFAICETKGKPENAKRNCIECHMPQVHGSLSTITRSRTHAYHGFAGLHNGTVHLAATIGLGARPKGDRTVVTITNEANHRLFNHPLRLGRLQIEVTRGGRTFPIDPVDFYTVLGQNGKPSMPWAADRVIAARTIEANGETEVEFPFKVQKGDRLTVTLGYFIVNPKAAKKLEITDESLKSFRRLKSQTFQF